VGIGRGGVSQIIAGNSVCLLFDTIVIGFLILLTGGHGGPPYVRDYNVGGEHSQGKKGEMKTEGLGEDKCKLIEEGRFSWHG
jgi:hypothetical protein